MWCLCEAGTPHSDLGATVPIMHGLVIGTVGRRTDLPADVGIVKKNSSTSIAERVGVEYLSSFRAHHCAAYHSSCNASSSQH